MRILIAIFLLTTTTAIYGQSTKYPKDYYKPFAGQINIIDSGTVQYNNDVLIIEDTFSEYFYLFQHGILHSGLFGGGKANSIRPNTDTMSVNQKAFYALMRTDTLTIFKISERSFRGTSSKVKRFEFWLFRNGFANPIEYHFELTNPKATNRTNLTTFIQGSKLTSFKQWSIIM